MIIDNSALIIKSFLIHSWLAAHMFVKCYQKQLLGCHSRTDYLDASRLFYCIVQYYEETSPCAAVADSIYDNRGTWYFLGLWRINPIRNMPYFKAWLMIVTPQVLRRHRGLLQSEVYMELTQLELMVNDSCWLPPGTHLSRIKVFLHALFPQHIWGSVMSFAWPLRSSERWEISC